MLVWPACNVVRSTSGRPAKVGRLKDTIPALAGEEKGHSFLEEDDLFRFLKKRAGKLEAVVITGREPTLHPDLPDFIKKIRKLGYLVKLDTNGANPAMLKKLIERKLIDYIAMDFKAPAEKYEKTTGVKVDFKKIKKSVKIIRESKLPYEFRTTLVRGFLVKNDIKKMGELIKGAEKWFLQRFRSETDLVDKKLKNKKAFTDKEMKEMRAVARKYVKKCEIR